MNDRLNSAVDVAHIDRIDDCWNRIGVRGDGSCPKLEEYVHCRNCPVHDAAAARVLDRVEARIEAHDFAKAPSAEQSAEAVSYLVFRIGDEWLGLPTAIFRQVAQLRPIHSLPHRRHRAVLGVVNVRGRLLVCASLARLFGIEAAQPQAASRASSTAIDARELGRLLVVEGQGEANAGPIVFPVDAVDGVHRFARSAFKPVPATLAHHAASHARAVVAFKGVTVGLLDAERLLDTLNRSLT
ncbi:chemotaxis protein CheW [Caballeronia humi]|uniref:Chemotaxis protein CheW n=1 Tax=Caballeronia humi TaxID=326474 RepID=A0A158GLH2_9BURK|nr:chemotaxis protein CheW [Caballeronia humi]SAL32978.1 chemotaxis protein CheW [Caballeronia humi]